MDVVVAGPAAITGIRSGFLTIGIVCPQISVARGSSSSLLGSQVCGSSSRWIWGGQSIRAPRIMHEHRRVDSSGFSSTRRSLSCRAKAKNTSANNRRTQAKKKLVGDSNSGDDARDLQAKKDPLPSKEGNIPRGFGGNGSGKSALHTHSSATPTGDEVIQAVESDVLVSGRETQSEKPLLVDEEEATKAVKASLGNLGGEDVTLDGVSVNDLMDMIKQAERNIMLLNQARARALDDLEQAKGTKDALQGQLHVLQARLTEANEKIKLGDETIQQNRLLEEELGSLQARLAEKESSLKAALELEAEYKSLQEHSQNLASRLVASTATENQLRELSSQTETYEEEIVALRLSVADLKAREKIIEQLAVEKSGLQEYASGLELKLSELQQKVVDFASTQAHEAALREEVDQLKAQLEEVSDHSSTAKLLLQETETLRNQIQSLQDALQTAESDKDALNAAQVENARLQEIIQKLQERLIESDTEIREQLVLYQAEMGAFQASLEGLKAESEFGVSQVPVGEMPWEFWSSLLLRIDALLLDKQLSLEDALELRNMAWRRESRIKDSYVAVQNEKDADVVAGLTELTKLKQKPGYHVVHIGAEMAPVAKVGGLGDVVTGLGKALQKKGHLVEIILPKYDCMDYSRIKNLKVLDVELYSYFDGQTHKNKIWHGIVEGLPVYFIEPHHPAKFFWRGQFYGENDDFKRFTYFCRAALEFLLQSGKRPDMIHTHDWQTAAVAPLYWDIYVPQGLDSARLAFTCHNFEYQGTDSPGALASCGLNVQQLNRQDRMQDNYNHGRVNLLKGGLVFSNVITTVSPTYAQEVRAPEAGRGLHLTLAQHFRKFVGILNGIDDEAWNPATDPLLQFQYSADDLSGKSANKSALRSRLGLATADSERPLVAVITRLVPQKGVHLIRHAIYRTLESGGQFVLLGSSPVPSIQSEFEGIAKQFEHHPDIRLVLKYDEGLSHSIYAASDLFIIPSIFEPCGLTQMIAMRYGSIPVARKTGGLADSVFDLDDPSIPEDKKNGFTFSAADEAGLNYALDRALAYYKSDKLWWKNLVRKAMKIDFSWDFSADQYVDLYRQCIQRAQAQV
ncbi:unnamed protein product [Calypogeia fissa]